MIRRRQLGVRIRRQVVLGPFVVDFFAPSARVVVEVDGGIHMRRGIQDARRDEWLESRGYRVVRIPAEMVERSPEQALWRIYLALQGAE